MEEKVSGLNEFQKLQAKEIAKIVIDDIKENFVCTLHCGKQRGEIYRYMYVLSFLVVIALGAKGLEILKLIP